MKKKILIFAFLCVSLVGFSQNYNEALNRLIYKTSKQDRDLMKKFVLSEGELRYYNEFYGDCPFYQFNDIDVYLLPIDALTGQVSEYEESKDKEYSKYALLLEYNNTNEITDNTSINRNIRSEINYIIKFVKGN